MIMQPPPHQVCRIIRLLRKQQCRDSSMPLEVTRFIQENGLVREDNWPGYHLTITERGFEYLAEHEPVYSDSDE